MNEHEKTWLPLWITAYSLRRAFEGSVDSGGGADTSSRRKGHPIALKEIRFSQHGKKRLAERGISIREVICALTHGRSRIAKGGLKYKNANVTVITSVENVVVITAYRHRRKYDRGLINKRRTIARKIERYRKLGISLPRQKPKKRYRREQRRQQFLAEHIRRNDHQFRRYIDSHIDESFLKRIKEKHTLKPKRLSKQRREKQKNRSKKKNEKNKSTENKPNRK